MTRAFPNIAKWWKNFISRLTAYLKLLFQGNTVEVLPALAGPVLNLGGGGPDVEAAIQWMINQVRGTAKVNVVVLRAYGGNDYNHLIYRMSGVNSVQTLVISNRQDANRDDIVQKVLNSGVVFFAGGDQCQYIRSWKNTKLEKAVASVYRRGGAVGGTSAGAMIMSDFIYDACACEDPIETKDALEDPYQNITFTYNFFQWSHLRGTIIDTHFDSRKRMGRIMAFIARQIQDGVSRSALGIAISEETSVVVDKYGKAKVLGRNAAYFVLGDHPPEICKPRTPLTYSDYKIWRVPCGDTFDLNNPPARGYYFRSVKRGRFDSDPY
ncbi:cyanophycinase [Nostoc parmelioides]|uniref:Cyanophycinase n=1 Tax=Nostoc parmelioides FACHB-3921 TaxID=2692909 RepID=A0ABR8B8Q8_9NOSO|nr:cyanophycinase [Nostoc parmelioides]MBD2250170.1 Type 1 glutamine amidotransferase-like domain-containing protein [Nostoc parmelioides FACHB-3921]